MTVKVLLVDDEAGIRKVLKIYLQDEGYEVTTADDGKKAAQKVEKEFFDIVL
jgi:CheY-like chemotaxis protein